MASGVLAFGDSITNAGGPIQGGVALQSWAMWTARGLGLPYTPYAVDGARADDVVAYQIPLFREIHANRRAKFELGCLYIGTNDIRHPDWDPVRFRACLDEGLSFLEQRCTRIVTATLPLTVGRPPAPVRITEANEIIESVASAHGALVIDLRDFRGRNLIMADHVHPTAFGQIAIAERALAVLAADGLGPRLHPSLLVRNADGRYRRLRADLSYGWQALKQSGAQNRRRVLGR